MEKYINEIYDSAKEVRNLMGKIMDVENPESMHNIKSLHWQHSIAIGRYRELTNPEIMIKLIELSRKKRSEAGLSYD